MNHGFSCADSPIGKSPIEGNVDPLTIGVRGLELYVNRAHENRELPKRDYPIPERKVAVEGCCG